MTSQVTRLTTWLKSAGISWNEDLIQLRPGRTGLAVFALQKIQEGQKLCDIPKSSVLSVKNTEIANILENHKLGGGLGLIIALMYELSIGEKSVW